MGIAAISCPSPSDQLKSASAQVVSITTGRIPISNSGPSPERNSTLPTICAEQRTGPSVVIDRRKVSTNTSLASMGLSVVASGLFAKDASIATASSSDSSLVAQVLMADSVQGPRGADGSGATSKRSLG